MNHAGVQGSTAGERSLSLDPPRTKQVSRSSGMTATRAGLLTIRFYFTTGIDTSLIRLQ
jgi:hypothetical protein